MLKIKKIQRYKYLVLYILNKKLYINITAMPVDKKKAVLTFIFCFLPRISIKYGSKPKVS